MTAGANAETTANVVTNNRSVEIFMTFLSRAGETAVRLSSIRLDVFARRRLGASLKVHNANSHRTDQSDGRRAELERRNDPPRLRRRRPRRRRARDGSGARGDRLSAARSPR